ncbi:MAG: putative nucleic acid-binding protein contains domain [Betaproteobacteria bacterium]|nr:putative nucleic acid-binding protein contains domain [Betaproteobacteria bacterium]
MYLLDTNVVSELRKVSLGRADSNVAQWAEGVDAAELYLSVVTLQELEVGVLLTERRDPAQGAVFRGWLERHVIPAFSGRVLPVDAAVARRSAQLHVPNQRPVLDALIAATALVHSLKVVTRNVGDFAATGVEVVNPWFVA